MSRFKTLSSKILDKNPFNEYKKDEFETEKGKKGEYYYIETNGFSLVMPITDDGRLVLVSQYRYLKDKLSIEFPCGGIAQKETSTEAAKRELVEETGYQAKEFIKVGEFESANSLIKDNSHIYVGMELEKVGEPVLEINGEELEVMLRRPDEFEEMIKRGDIWDGQTLAAWTLAREHVLKIINEYAPE